MDISSVYFLFNTLYYGFHDQMKAGTLSPLPRADEKKWVQKRKSVDIHCHHRLKERVFKHLRGRSGRSVTAKTGILNDAYSKRTAELSFRHPQGAFGIPA